VEVCAYKVREGMIVEARDYRTLGQALKAAGVK